MKTIRRTGIVVCLLLLAGIVVAAILTDPNTVTAPPIQTFGKPVYMGTIAPSYYGTTIKRITGDPNTPYNYSGFGAQGPGSSVWGSGPNRPVGYDRQAFNADQSVIYIDLDGGGLSALLLSASDYTPLAPVCGPGGDWRWHPLVSSKYVRVGVTGSTLYWYDAFNCVYVKQTSSWPSGFSPDGIGPGEGNVTKDGRYVVLQDSGDHTMALVDMNPPGGGFLVGTPVSFADALCGAAGHVALSPTGKYAIVKYSCSGDRPRLYITNLATLSLAPATYESPQLCGSPTGMGFLYGMGHEDFIENPFDLDTLGNPKEYLVGQQASICGGAHTEIVKVRLEDGAIFNGTPAFATTPSRNEERVHHVSARAVNRPGGWYFGSYRTDDPGDQFYNEIIAVQADTQVMERWAHARGTPSGCSDDDEIQAVPSPDGTRVLFRSNWRLMDPNLPSCRVDTYVVYPTTEQGGGGGHHCGDCTRCICDEEQ